MLEVVSSNLELNVFKIMMGAEVDIINFVLDRALALTHHDNPHKTILFWCVRTSPDSIRGVKATNSSKAFGSDASGHSLIWHHWCICAFGFSGMLGAYTFVKQKMQSSKMSANCLF